MSASTRQINDVIFDILATYYAVPRTDYQVNDLFVRWLDDMGITWGDSLSAFYTAQTGIVNYGDAQWAYWNELGDSYATEDGGLLLQENGSKLLTQDAFTFS